MKKHFIALILMPWCLGALVPSSHADEPAKLLNIAPATDHVANTCALVDTQFRAALTAIASALDTSIKAVQSNDNHTAAEFWSRAGTKGATVLQEMAAWRAILQAKAPDLLTDRITRAGTGLTVHQNGTVTVDP